jgi:rod shape-determining protein MreD
VTVRLLLRLILTTWAALAFRITLGPKLALGGVQPDFVAALVFYLTVVRGAPVGIIGGFVLGLLVDIERPPEMGLSSLAWATMAFATARASSSVDLRDRVLSSVVLFFAVLLAEFVRALGLGLASPSDIPLLVIRWGLPTALYTAVATPLLITLSHAVLGESRWLRDRP